jgi:hypothetical protein
LRFLYPTGIISSKKAQHRAVHPQPRALYNAQIPGSGYDDKIQKIKFQTDKEEHMGFSPEIENLLKISTGIFWSLAYLLIIRRGFKDHTFGMPFAALCANIAWEFIFSFVYPHQPPQLYINIAWFLLDTIIVFQFLRFGRPAFDSLLPKGSFYLVFLLSLLISFFIIVGITLEFQNWNAMYSAFAQNLIMSILFVVMLRSRNNLSGQSLYIAIFKMIGTMLPAILFYARNPSSVLMNSLYISIFIFDALYIVILYVKHKELGIQPWHRL